jgi:site-specific DNA-cytosine methylase
MYKRYTLQDTLDSEKRNLFNVLSTFAGGGGSSTGYRLAGGKILAINEFVPEAQNTYREDMYHMVKVIHTQMPLVKRNNIVILKV